ncbi:MAG: hypothetical protein ABW151_12035 [Pseudorhodoplanes sp.]
MGLYPGETVTQSAGYPVLSCFQAGQSGQPLVAFITGGGVLARIAYGYPEGRPVDFLFHWLREAGFPAVALSYPLAHPVFDATYPQFGVTDWGIQSAQEIARVIEANNLARRVIVMAWSMAGHVAEPVTVSLKEHGIEVELLVAMAASTALPSPLPGVYGLKPAPSGLAQVEGPYLNNLLRLLRNQNDIAGHSAIDPAIFPPQFTGDFPINLLVGGMRYRDGAIVSDALADAQDTGAFRYANFPPIAVLTHESPLDVRHALIDRAAWGFYMTQALLENFIYAKVKDFAALPHEHWLKLNALIRQAPALLTELLPGNHMFFVGEDGARKTVAALIELRRRSAVLIAELEACADGS